METDLRPSGRRSLLSATAANGAAGTLFAWSVLLPALRSDLGLTTGRLGPVFSTALVVFAVAVLLGGRSVDRLGPRRVALAAGVLSGSGIGLAAAAPGLLTLHLGIGVLFGAGSGLTYLSTVTWASTRGGEHRGRATGLVVASYATGPVAAAPLGVIGIDRVGLRATLVVAAVLVGGVVLLAARGLPGPLPLDRAVPGPPMRDGLGDTGALVALWLVFFGSVVPGLLAFGYAAEIAAERGLSARGAGVVVALMATGNLAGRLLASSLSGRVGPGGALGCVVGALVGSLTALAWSSAAVVAVLVLPVVALQYGLVSALLPGATRRVSGDRRFGTAYGRVFSSFGAAAVVGPGLGAVLYDGEVGYARSFLAALAGGLVASVALAVYLRRTRLGTSR